jgi:uncharacterized membrane protein
VSASPPRDTLRGVDVRLPAAAYARMTLVLRVGLVSSLSILAAVLGVYLAQEPSATSEGTVGSNPALPYLSLNGLLSGLAAGSAPAYLMLGLLVLVATPLVRVLSGLYYFRRGGERAMAGVTITVFALLVVGLLFVGPLVR